jgi:Zn finger protein HypA/HybF involved in hydrogenase expression
MDEEVRRKGLPDQYVKCQRCYGHHEQLTNIDQLCEKCEQETAPMRYDKGIK